MRIVYCSLALCFASMPVVGFAEAAPEKPVSVAERELVCVLGRSTNLDPSRNQKASEVISEGRHPFIIRLPATTVTPSANPDPSDPAEPVDPRTAILSDPDGLAAEVPRAFDRVVDLWPKRVELMTALQPPIMNVIIISAINPKAMTAHLFMTRAKDAATLDLERVYQGDCTIKFARGAAR